MDRQAPTHEARVPHPPASFVLRAILFSDVIDSTRFADRFGDVRYVELLERHDRIVEEAVATHDGELVKSTGDGAMCAFLSATAAVLAAITIQRVAIGSRIPLRVGVDHGGVARCGSGDYRGLVANVASRLTAMAEQGQIVVSDRVAVAARLAGRTEPCAVRGLHCRQHVRTLSVSRGI